MLVALDTNILLAALLPHEPGSSVAQDILRQLNNPGSQAVISALACTEMLSVSSHGLGKDTTIEQFFFSLPNTTIVAADAAICLQAGNLRKQFAPGLKLADAIHLATALHEQAALFITNDYALAKIAGKVIPTKTLADF